MVGEIGPELFVPSQFGQIFSNQMISKQLEAAKQSVSYANTSQFNSNDSAQTLMQGTSGLTVAMESLRKQLADDNNRAYGALQEQLNKLDDLVREMRNNTSANENIANMLA
jgi:predicted histidine transporter YuiF (NhaC family)